MVVSLKPSPSPIAIESSTNSSVSGISERDAAVARVMLEAHDLFNTSVAPDVLLQFVEEAVDELWIIEPRVTAFVPILAMRRVRERVDSLEVDTVRARSTWN